MGRTANRLTPHLLGCLVLVNCGSPAVGPHVTLGARQTDTLPGSMPTLVCLGDRVFVDGHVCSVGRELVRFNMGRSSLAAKSEGGCGNTKAPEVPLLGAERHATWPRIPCDPWCADRSRPTLSACRGS